MGVAEPRSLGAASTADGSSLAGGRTWGAGDFFGRDFFGRDFFVGLDIGTSFPQLTASKREAAS
jgi:hypothetical protein